PPVAAADGEVRGAVAEHPRAGGVLDERDRSPQVAAELLRLHAVDRAVGMPVARHLVPVVVNAPDQVGETLSRETEDEERGPDAGIREQVEDPQRVVADPGGYRQREVQGRLAPVFDTEPQDVLRSGVVGLHGDTWTLPEGPCVVKRQRT